MNELYCNDFWERPLCHECRKILHGAYRTLDGRYETDVYFGCDDEKYCEDCIELANEKYKCEVIV